MKNENLNSNEETYLALWLDGQISDDELKTLVSQKEFDSLINMREQLMVFEGLERPLDASFAELQRKITQRRSSPSRKYWMTGIAACLLICFGLFTFLKPTNSIYETGFGEHKVVTLPDGSEVVLNAKSQLTYDVDDWKNSRFLDLEGEAYFKVAKGKTFTVNTKLGKVEVLGTEFNVNSTLDFFEVVCFEGSVKVTQDNKEVILKPKDNVRKINGFPVEQSIFNSEAPDWINGESTFRSVPLKYVISDFENHYNVKIDASNIDTSQTFTGSFTHENKKIALKTVFEAMKISYNEKENNIIVLGAN